MWRVRRLGPAAQQIEHDSSPFINSLRLVSLHFSFTNLCGVAHISNQDAYYVSVRCQVVPGTGSPSIHQARRAESPYLQSLLSMTSSLDSMPDERGRGKKAVTRLDDDKAKLTFLRLCVSGRQSSAFQLLSPIDKDIHPSIPQVDGVRSRQRVFARVQDSPSKKRGLNQQTGPGRDQPKQRLLLIRSLPSRHIAASENLFTFAPSTPKRTHRIVENCCKCTCPGSWSLLHAARRPRPPR